MRALMYHRVEEVGGRFGVPLAKLEAQAAWLASAGWTVKTLRAAAAAPDQETVVLTFDDGTADTFESAWPVLRRNGLTATVFLVTDAMGGALHWSRSSVPMMNWSQAREMAEEGAELGSHTATHLDLRTASIAAIRKELKRSKAAIEDQVGTEVVSFAYPFGYFRVEMPDLLAEAGYQWATLAGTCGRNTSATAPYELRRIHIDGRASLSAFRRKVSGRCDWQYYTAKVRQELLWQGKCLRRKVGFS